MKAGEELWLHSRVQMVHMASGDAQPCTAAVRGSNNEPRSRGNSQSLYLGPCAKHCPPGVPAHWPHAQSCLRAKPWVSLAAVTTAPLWFRSHHSPRAPRGQQEEITIYLFCFYILHASLYWPLYWMRDLGLGRPLTCQLTLTDECCWL